MKPNRKRPAHRHPEPPFLLHRIPNIDTEHRMHAQVFPPTAALRKLFLPLETPRCEKSIYLHGALSLCGARPQSAGGKKPVGQSARQKNSAAFLRAQTFNSNAAQSVQRFFPSWWRERIFSLSVRVSHSFPIPSARLECLLGYNACSGGGSREIRSAPTLGCCR
jgi:hypothetical protein